MTEGESGIPYLSLVFCWGKLKHFRVEVELSIERHLDVLRLAKAVLFSYVQSVENKPQGVA